jgi:ADP-ribosylglycohydrolase
VPAANGGRDVDTVAAMAGALAGAYLGEASIRA